MTSSALQTALYPSRSGAGAFLGRHIYQRCAQPLVLIGITPTGVEVAASAAKAVGARFDVIVGAHVRLRNVGVIGAIAEDADAVIDQEYEPGFDAVDELDEAMDRARRAIKSERVLFRGPRPIRSLTGTNVVVVDGHATSPWKLLASVKAVLEFEPAGVWAAAAAATKGVKERITARRVEFICPSIVLDPQGHPRPFGDPEDPSAERLRSIVIAREAA